MKKLTILLVAVMLCGMTMAEEKNLQLIDQRIAPPSFGPMDGTWCSAPGAAIPDSDPIGVTDVLNIGDSEIIANLDVSIQATHTWIGDLQFTLSNGNCTVALIDRIGHAGSGFGCSGDDIDSTLDDDAEGGSVEDSCTTGPSGGSAGIFTPDPGSLADCNGEDVNGDWSMLVVDNAGGDTGTLDEWCMTTSPATGGDGGGGAVPATGTTGLIILAVLLMIGGSLFVMRRRNA